MPILQSKYRDDILRLNKEGISGRQIAKTLGCSTACVERHLSNTTRETQRRARNNWKKNNPWYEKLSTFCRTKNRWKNNRISKCSFLDKINKRLNNFADYTMTQDDKQKVIERLKENPVCYLTGQTFDIYDTYSYNFDHIVPPGKGGSNEIDNLGFATRQANLAKTNMTVDEFIQLCKTVLEHNGFEVIKKEGK